MCNFKNILALTENEQGKIFVVDESGEVKFVILPIDEYQQIKSGGKFSELSRRVADLAEQTEELNRQIIQAQMQDLSEDEDAESPVEQQDSDETDDTFYVEPIES